MPDGLLRPFSYFRKEFALWVPASGEPLDPFKVMKLKQLTNVSDEVQTAVVMKNRITPV
jgi:hypothetical protein